MDGGTVDSDFVQCCTRRCLWHWCIGASINLPLLCFWPLWKGVNIQSKRDTQEAQMHQSWATVLSLFCLWPLWKGVQFKKDTELSHLSIGLLLLFWPACRKKTSQELRMLSLSLFIECSQWMKRLQFTIVRNVASVSTVTRIYHNSLRVFSKCHGLCLPQCLCNCPRNCPCDCLCHCLCAFLCSHVPTFLCAFPTFCSTS